MEVGVASVLPASATCVTPLSLERVLAHCKFAATHHRAAHLCAIAAESGSVPNHAQAQHLHL